MQSFSSCLAHNMLTLFIFSSSLVIIWAEKVILFDSISTSPQKWNVRSVYGRTKSGWISESGAGTQGAEFTSCDQGIAGAQNFLVTPFISLDQSVDQNTNTPSSESSDILYYDIKFIVKSCDVAQMSPCSENIRLGRLETDSQMHLDALPIGTAVQYKQIKSELRQDEDPLSDAIRDIEISTTGFFQPEMYQKGLSLVFEDNGACVSILRVQVYKKVCPAEIHGFAEFPKTTAPALPMTTVNGWCVPNAVSSGRPKKVCYSSGDWDKESASAKCQCQKGFSPDVNNSTQCRACPRNTFKSQVGEEPCQKCPQFSSAPIGGASICECDPGRFRFITNNPLSPCFTNPSAPRNLQTLPVSSENRITSVRLTWDPPLNDGSENNAERSLELWYSFTCDRCGPEVNVEPAQNGIRTRSVVVTQLAPDTVYTFNIYSHNRLNDVTPPSDPSNKLAYGEISYKTPKAINVRELKAVGESGTIKVSWSPPQLELEDKPSGEKHGDDVTQNISYYYVRIRKRVMGGGLNEHTNMITTHRNQKVPANQTHVEFSGVDGGEYLVDVSTSGMTGPYCNPVSVHVLGIDDQYMMQRKVQRVVLTIILLALVFLLFLSIFMIALCFYRKKQRWGYLAAGAGGYGPHGNRPSSAVLHQNSLLNYVGMESTLPWWNHNLTADLSQQEYLLFSQESAMKLPVGQRFVEPKIFDPPERILVEFTREIDPRAIQRYAHPNDGDQTGRIDNQVKIWLNLSGGGEFGNYNCSQTSSNSSSDLATAGGGSPVPKGNSNCVVAAAKTLKMHFTPDMWRKFAIEAATIAQFNHPNVVMIHGVITATEDSPKMLILEYCERGSLECLLSLMTQIDVTNSSSPPSTKSGATDKGEGGGTEAHLSEGQGQMQCNKTVSNNVSQITHILRGIACGMHYLADEGYVHKVLRARNIFISGSLVPKIAGFDERTCLEEEMEVYFQSVNSRSSHYDMWPLPLVFEDICPWTAPEALLPPHKFSCFSDSWSFGCLIWECFSLGERPFGQLNAAEISNLMTNMNNPWSGFPKPKLCPPSLYELLCMCCSPGQVPHKRPWFNQIRELLDNVIRSNIPLESTGGTGVHNYQYVTGSRMSNTEQQKLAAKMGDMHSMELSPTEHMTPSGHVLSPVPAEGIDIQELLISLRLEKYGENFKVHGYYTLSEVLAAIEMNALGRVDPNTPGGMGMGMGMDSSKLNDTTWTRCCQRFLKQIGIVKKKDRNLMVKKLKSFLFHWGDNYTSFTTSIPSPMARTQYLHQGNL